MVSYLPFSWTLSLLRPFRFRKTDSDQGCIQNLLPWSDRNSDHGNGDLVIADSRFYIRNKISSR